MSTSDKVAELEDTIATLKADMKEAMALTVEKGPVAKPADLLSNEEKLERIWYILSRNIV